MLAAQKSVKRWAKVSPLRRPWIRAGTRRFAAACPVGIGTPAIMIDQIPLFSEEGNKGRCANHRRSLLIREGSADIGSY